jgi:hypothetical protein
VGEYDALLERHLPQLLYDSNEQFFADAAEEVLALGHAELRRRDPRGDVTLVAGADLTLDVLGPTYPGDLGPAENGDYLICVGQDHRELSQQMHAREELRNRIHGRAKHGGDGRLWLQYWLYYFYNDYSMAGGFGLHEGDWELVQLRMKEDPEQGPDQAVYAQHKHAELREWDPGVRDGGVEKLDGVRPVVYVACGSHASYFEQGLHRAGPVWWDVTDGERGSPADTRLVVVGDDALPGWITWPGVWGGTRARLKDVEQPSPPGPRGPEPNHRPHWDDPARIERRETPARRVPLPGRPPVEIARNRDRVVVAWDFHELLGGEHPPERVNVTVNKQQGANEFPRTPPRTYTYALEHTHSGRMEIEAWLDPDREYDVRVRLVSTGGRPTDAKAAILGKPPPDQGGIRRWNAVARGIKRAWARTGGPAFDLLHRGLRRLRGRR